MLHESNIPSKSSHKEESRSQSCTHANDFLHILHIPAVQLGVESRDVGLIHVAEDDQGQ